MTDLEVEQKSELVEKLLEEYLKPAPNKRDLKRLMKQLDIEYHSDDLVNMKAVLDTFNFIEKER